MGLLYKLRGSAGLGKGDRSFYCLGRRAFTRTLLSTLSIAGLARAVEPGNLHGVVKLVGGGLLEGCLVELVGHSRLQMKSGEDGVFQFLAVSAGAWELRARLPGFPGFKQNVLVREGKDTKLTIWLELPIDKGTYVEPLPSKINAPDSPTIHR